MCFHRGVRKSKGSRLDGSRQENRERFAHESAGIGSSSEFALAVLFCKARIGAVVLVSDKVSTKLTPPAFAFILSKHRFNIFYLRLPSLSARMELAAN